MQEETLQDKPRHLHNVVVGSNDLGADDVDVQERLIGQIFETLLRSMGSNHRGRRQRLANLTLATFSLHGTSPLTRSRLQKKVIAVMMNGARM